MAQRPKSANLKSSLNDEALTVAAVARRLGVAPATLRTWDRRYGLGPSSHVEGEHRRYNAKDLARITLMRKLIIQGYSPSDAAQAALKSRTNSIESSPNKDAAYGPADCANLIESILRAARVYDRSYIENTLRDQVSKRGIIATWNELIVPVLIAVGNEWAELGTGIEIEHLLTEIITRLMQSSNQTPDLPINSRPVLLACIGEEMHTLALYTLGAALAERNIQSQFLGARTPISAVGAVVKKSAPPAVFLWAQLAKNGKCEVVGDIPKIRPAPRIILGGPGWRKSSRKSVVRVDCLDSAITEITRAVGA
jgi:DNA-binding transcriptional MerR regulator